MLKSIGLNYFALEKTNVFTEEECNEIIEKAEREGFSYTQINKFGTSFNDPNLRNDQSVSILDRKLALKLLHRIEDELQFIPNLTINKNLRFSKFKEGNKCQPHLDAQFVKSNGTDDIQCTVILYLNKTIDGGATRLFNVETMKHIDVMPEPGKVLIFDQRVPHAGLTVKEGLKYHVRADLYVNPPTLTISNTVSSTSSTAGGSLQIFD